MASKLDYGALREAIDQLGQFGPTEEALIEAWLPMFGMWETALALYDNHCADPDTSDHLDGVF